MELQDKQRARFLCFMCIRIIKGLRAEPILETGSNVLENNDPLCDVLLLLLLLAARLLTAAGHCITVHSSLGRKPRWWREHGKTITK